MGRPREAQNGWPAGPRLQAPLGTAAVGVNLELSPGNLRTETPGLKQLCILVLRGGIKKSRTFWGLMIVTFAGSWTPFPYIQAEELGHEGSRELSGLWALRLATPWFRCP